MMTMLTTKMKMTAKWALAQIPISTFSHIWVFVRQYGVMFVIICNQTCFSVDTFTFLYMMIMMMMMTALAQIPISTFSHILVFVCQYGIMFVIIVIIIIIIIIYRKVKVSTLKHV